MFLSKKWISVTDFSGLTNLISVFVKHYLVYLRTLVHLIIATVVQFVFVQHGKARCLQPFQQRWLHARHPHKVREPQERAFQFRMEQD